MSSKNKNSKSDKSASKKQYMIMMDEGKDISKRRKRYGNGIIYRMNYVKVEAI